MPAPMADDAPGTKAKGAKARGSCMVAAPVCTAAAYGSAHLHHAKAPDIHGLHGSHDLAVREGRDLADAAERRALDVHVHALHERREALERAGRLDNLQIGAPVVTPHQNSAAAPAQSGQQAAGPGRPSRGGHTHAQHDRWQPKAVCANSEVRTSSTAA